MRYRVDELAARGDVSVDTVRFYQSKGLLPQPEREGRVAWYGDDHLERLLRIRDLKAKGFTLGSIRHLLSGDIDPADRALIAALAETLPGDDKPQAGLTLDGLARRTNVSPALLEAIEREGLIAPRLVDGQRLYSGADADVIAAGLELLGTGIPLSELLALAREHNDAMRTIAARAVDMFLSFVRDPIRAGADDDEDAALRLVEAFRKMLPATTSLVTSHFTSVLLSEAQARIEAEGLESELDAVRAEAARVREGGS